MIRDARMQALVSGAKEPITPFIQRVRCLFEHNGVSSILVIGGAGDYFDVADLVIMLDCYAAFDRTNEAKRIATHFSSISQTTVCAIPSSPLPSPPSSSVANMIPNIPTGESGITESLNPFERTLERIPVAETFKSGGGKISARSKWMLTYGGERELDLSGVEQLVEESQTRAIGDAISMLSLHIMSQRNYRGAVSTVITCLDQLERELNTRGLDALAIGSQFGAEAHIGNYARPRRVDVAAALNRLREVLFTQLEGSKSSDDVCSSSVNMS